MTTLWYTRCPVPTASSIAINQGWLDAEFAPDGITVSSLGVSSDKAVRESHFDHTQANSFRQGGNIPPIWTRSRGNDLRLIGLSWAEQYQAIVALRGSGLHAPADLRGKKIGIARRLNDQIDFWRATSLRGFESTLALADLTLDDVQIVDLPVDQAYLDSATASTGSLFGAATNRRLQAAELIALLRGEVDAIYVAGGRGPDLEALTDVDIVFDLRAHPDRSIRINNITPAALTVSGQLLDGRPDLVTRYVAATVRAARWARDNAVETRRIVAREVGIAEDFVVPGYTDIHTILEPTLDEELIRGIESQKDFLLRHGFITNDFDVRSWIDAGPLDAALKLLADS